ncbi:MAG: ChuX/HutX family heme-like substrate-binding protein [Gemmatimonadaceae bacterium]|nr:ChuX/HutX family heme-like substrate-binding protein [Gemmatimonadaceae bacterium]
MSETSTLAPQSSVSEESEDALRTRWLDYRAANPKVYLRDAAAVLGVSELALLLVSEATLTRLRSADWPVLIAAFERFGAVRTMTRNEFAVIEQHGAFSRFESFGAMAQTLGQIDTRMFLREWATAWAVESPVDGAVRRSVQVFDASGDSIHKFFVDEAQAELFAAFVTEFAVHDVPAPVFAARQVVQERPDAEIDTVGMLATWDAMTDTHQFHGLLRTYGVTRTQALRLAGPSRARRVPASALQQLLKGAASTGEKLMIFVGNRGIVQIYIGTIQRVVHAAGWLNILDPGFNLHARDTAFAESWVVTKSSADGPIRSLEVYDASGGTILQVFGKRLEGQGSTPPGFDRLLDDVLTSAT